LAKHILTKPPSPTIAPMPPRATNQPPMEQLPDDELHELEGNS
jgi:hypothetical protein